MISFVIPTKNNQASISELFRQIRNQCDQLQKEFEVLFIDYGSRDKTWSILSQLTKAFPRNVRAIQLRKQSSLEHALQIGFHKTLGDVTFIMSADLKDDPVAIPQFLKKLEEGSDIVVGYKKHFEQESSRFSPKRVLHKIISTFCGINLNHYNSGYLCSRSEIMREMGEYANGGISGKFPLSAEVDGYSVSKLTLKTRSKTSDSRFSMIELITLNYLKNCQSNPHRIPLKVASGLFIIGMVLIFIAQSGGANSVLLNVIGSGLLLNIIPLLALSFVIDVQFFRASSQNNIKSLIYSLVMQDTTEKLSWRATSSQNNQQRQEDTKVFN